MALELVGGALLSAFLQVTFEKLASAGIQHYFQHKKLNPKLLNNLNITLLSINAVLDDAELKQFSIQPVRDWLDAVKDALFDAEDLLEEIDYEVTRSKLEAESLRIITLENLKSLPECMATLFPSLFFLAIEDCPQLESFSDEGLPSNLEILRLERCSKLVIDSLKWALGINTSLKELHIENVDVESFPDEGLLPLSLTYLLIRSCHNLKKLDHKGLCHLSSLKRLTLNSCPSLQCLPVKGLPKSISTLEITQCLLLEQRCKKPNGEDWDKISHIQEVKINEELIT